MPNPELVLESSPHLRTEESVHRIMWTVTLTLLPAVFAAVYVFGFRALLLMLVCMIGSLSAELLAVRWRNTVWRLPDDGSIVVTGLLLGLTLPPGFPLFEAFLGGVYGNLHSREFSDAMFCKGLHIELRHDVVMQINPVIIFRHYLNHANSISTRIHTYNSTRCL